jgi:hypothetical protein
MTLQSSGAISMSQINTEFGRGNNLNAYRGTSHSTGTFPSGAISFSDFYGKSIPPSGGTFSPDGSTSSGSRTLLYDFYIGEAGGTAQVSISCTQSASWTWTRTGGSFGAGQVDGSTLVASGSGTGNTAVFILGTGFNQFRQCEFYVDATSGSNTRYWRVVLDTEYSGCPFCCFTPDTLISMGDGSTKQIGDIKAGDFILVYDDLSQLNVAVPVKEVIVREDRPMYTYTFENGKTLVASEDHPLYVVGKGYVSINPSIGYKDMGVPGHISVGDFVVNELGIQTRITGIEPHPYKGVVYTFGNSKFYANGVLVY